MKSCGGYYTQKVAKIDAEMEKCWECVEETAVHIGEDVFRCLCIEVRAGDDSAGDG